MVSNVRYSTATREDGTTGYYELGLSWGSISFQNGPVQEVGGRNGAFIEEILEGVLMHRLKQLNDKFPCRENSLALTNMEQALMWLNRRTQLRELQKVEALNLSHIS